MAGSRCCTAEPRSPPGAQRETDVYRKVLETESWLLGSRSSPPCRALVEHVRVSSIADLDRSGVSIDRPALNDTRDLAVEHRAAIVLTGSWRGTAGVVSRGRSRRRRWPAISSSIPAQGGTRVGAPLLIWNGFSCPSDRESLAHSTTVAIHESQSRRIVPDHRETAPRWPQVDLRQPMIRAIDLLLDGPAPPLRASLPTPCAR